MHRYSSFLCRCSSSLSLTLPFFSARATCHVCARDRAPFFSFARSPLEDFPYLYTVWLCHLYVYTCIILARARKSEWDAYTQFFETRFSRWTLARTRKVLTIDGGIDGMVSSACTSAWAKYWGRSWGWRRDAFMMALFSSVFLWNRNKFLLNLGKFFWFIVKWEKMLWFWS